MKVLDREKFLKQLQIVRDDYNFLSKKLNKKLLDDLAVLFDDLSGVLSTRITKVVDNHLATLFMAVNPLITDKDAYDLVDFYVWEYDFGGEVSIGDKKYNIVDDNQLYDFIADYMQEEK